MISAVIFEEFKQTEIMEKAIKRYYASKNIKPKMAVVQWLGYFGHKKIY